MTGIRVWLMLLNVGVYAAMFWRYGWGATLLLATGEVIGCLVYAVRMIEHEAILMEEIDLLQQKIKDLQRHLHGR